MNSDDVEGHLSAACTGQPGVPIVPTPRDLEAYMPYALEALQAPFKVRVHSLMQDEYVPMGKPSAKKQLSSKSTVTANILAMSSGSLMDSLPQLDDESATTELVVTVVCDSQGHVVEVMLCEMKVPCMLLKLVILCAPFQTLLTRLTLHSCRLDALALNQLIHLLTGTQVSELSLNDTRLSCGGFHLLLEMESHLRWLSLDRCSVGDHGAVKLAALLRHPYPGSVSLKALSLACNGIGDTGARAFAEALRSNRQLQYLNLADNCVTDAGAIPLLRSLCEFSLSYEEVNGARRRRMTRLRLKQQLYTRIYAELLGQPPASVAKRRKSRKTSTLTLVTPNSHVSETVATKAEAMAEDQLGPFLEPFEVAEFTERNNVLYCGGNTILTWLNLAYNSLGYASLVELAHVMAMQASMSSVGLGMPSGVDLGNARGSGLVRVVVEGNALPLACLELAAVTARIEAMLDRATLRANKKHNALKSKSQSRY